MLGRRANRELYPAAQRTAVQWQRQDIFVRTDVPKIVDCVKLPVADDLKKALIDGLNDAAIELFGDARRANAPTSSELEKWTARVASASADFLAALGFDAENPPVGSLDDYLREAFVTLTAWERDDFSEPKHADALNFWEVLGFAAGSAFSVHARSARAAEHYATQKVDRQSAAKRKGLKPRQRFTLSLAMLFNRCFGQTIPKYPDPGASPFLRFAKVSYDIVAERMATPTKSVTLPNDGSDAEMAKYLAEVNERQIAGDLKAVRGLVKSKHGPLAAPPTSALADIDISGLPLEVREILERGRDEVLAQKQTYGATSAANASEASASEIAGVPKKKGGPSRS
jgi:hypothetical protein